MTLVAELLLRLAVRLPDGARREGVAGVQVAFGIGAKEGLRPYIPREKSAPLI